VSYKLYFDPTIHKIYASLPEDARRDISMCLVDALVDPIGHTTAYGISDNVMRTIGYRSVTVAILISNDTGTITVVQISYAG
jgi:mRNA-degrading endonuclease RelE of RelBE toxin-antitoxin system